MARGQNLTDCVCSSGEENPKVSLGRHFGLSKSHLNICEIRKCCAQMLPQLLYNYLMFNIIMYSMNCRPKDFRYHAKYCNTCRDVSAHSLITLFTLQHSKIANHYDTVLKYNIPS